MKLEEKVVTVIALVGIDTGRVTELEDMAPTVFQFVDREVSVKRIAETMDGSVCYSVSAVSAGNLEWLAKLWLNASRVAGTVVFNERLSSDLTKWMADVYDVIDMEDNIDE